MLIKKGSLAAYLRTSQILCPIVLLGPRDEGQPATLFLALVSHPPFVPKPVLVTILLCTLVLGALVPQ